jgi:hypothetical protein
VRVGVEEELRLAEEVAAWKSNLVFTTNNQMFSQLSQRNPLTLGAVTSSTSSNSMWRTSLFVVEQKCLSNGGAELKSQDQNFVAARSTQMIGSAGKCPERSALLGARVLVQGMCWRAVGYAVDR